MERPRASLLLLSDPHYASNAEKARRHPEYTVISNPMLRFATKCFRYWIWMRDPFAHNHMLDRFLERAPEADALVAIGDYSCDSAFIGVADDASLQSARECLGRLRNHFGDRFWPVFGDHEIGKTSLFGGRGGPRLASWRRARQELGLEPFWTRSLGPYLLIGVVSTLIAWPVYEPESLKEERDEWRGIRQGHLDQIRDTFHKLEKGQKVLLFCHDPTAVPFLWREEAVRSRLDQIEQTWIGHLHSDLIFWKSRVLSGMPTIRFLGNSIRRMSAALSEARYWRDLKVRLCPSLSGIQCLKDGGFIQISLDLKGGQPARVEKIKLKW